MDTPILRFDRYNRPNPQTSPPSPAVCLEIKRGRAKKRTRQVMSPMFLIGTASDCDMVLGDPAFPETYAYLLVRQNGVTVRRVGSGPELLVNGEAVETAELVADDRLAFGPFELAVQIQLATTIIQPPSPALSIRDWPWLEALVEA